MLGSDLRWPVAQNSPDTARRTWIVERSFAWLGRNRRMSKDYECRVQTSEALIDVASIRFMLGRLTLV